MKENPIPERSPVVSVVNIGSMGERSGMGFSFMEAFMDQMCIRDRF